MKKKVDLKGAYIPSADVVVREIHGELIIVPITSGAGDIEDALLTLNETGKAVWQELKKEKDLNTVIKTLTREFNASEEEVASGVTGFIAELLAKKIVVRLV
jgi:hypothetical protein